MAYSSKDQEKFYKPLRVRVLRDNCWAVVVQNMDTHEIVEWGSADWRGEYVSWKTEASVHDREVRRFIKKTALAAAKEKAITENLPFDLQVDVISMSEAIYGPLVSCLICGGLLGHSFEPMICNQCTRDAETGAALRSEVSEWIVPKYEFVKTHGYHNRFIEAVLKAIFGMLGVSPVSGEYYPRENINLVYGKTRGSFKKSAYFANSIFLGSIRISFVPLIICCLILAPVTG